MPTITTVIDNFNSFVAGTGNAGTGSLASLYVNRSLPSATMTELGMNTANVIGRSRKSSLAYLPMSNASAYTLLSYNGTILNITNDNVGGGANGTLEVIWNNNNAGLSANFSSFDVSDSRFIIKFNSAINAGNIITITLTARRNVGSGGTSSRTVTSAVGATQAVFSLSAFSDPTFFSTPFNELILSSTGSAAYRFAINEIIITGTEVAVTTHNLTLSGISAIPLLGSSSIISVRNLTVQGISAIPLLGSSSIISVRNLTVQGINAVSLLGGFSIMAYLPLTIDGIETITDIGELSISIISRGNSILTELDAIQYAPSLSQTGYALTALLNQAQVIAESTLGACRILSVNKWVEKKFISYDYQSFYLAYVNQFIPLLENLNPIQIRVRHENFRDSFGRNNGGTTDWELLDDTQYETQVDGQVNLKLSTHFYGGYYNQYLYGAYSQKTARMEVEVTYYSGFDFSEESPEINQIKTWAGMIAEHLASANYQGVNKLVVPFREYEISFANSQPGLVPMSLLLPFKRFQPLTSIL